MCGGSGEGGGDAGAGAYGAACEDENLCRVAGLSWEEVKEAVEGAVVVGEQRRLEEDGLVGGEAKAELLPNNGGE